MRHKVRHQVRHQLGVVHVGGQAGVRQDHVGQLLRGQGQGQGSGAEAGEKVQGGLRQKQAVWRLYAVT